ncbi:MAG: hypothetical protein JSR46_00580 [Verrucomicrobia bacterium]|nr:hypothetical protein [Verrucomicrobiota bacterium]
MIELPADIACLIYLGIAVTVLLGIWLYSHLASRKKKQVEFPLQYHSCEFCNFTYLENPAEKLSRCPQCNLLNDKMT